MFHLGLRCPMPLADHETARASRAARVGRRTRWRDLLKPRRASNLVRAGSVRRRSRRASRLRAQDTEAYAFLVGALIDASTLARAIGVARRWRAPPHTVLIALGWITADAYCSALASQLGVGRWDGSQAARAGQTEIEATAYRPDELAVVVGVEARADRAVVLCVRRVIHPAILADSQWQAVAIMQAAQALKLRHPELSAGTAMWLWQRLASAIGCGMLLGGVAIAPAESLAVLSGLIAFPFVLVTALRLLALWHLVMPGQTMGDRGRQPAIPDAALPVYSVLVPLYDEAEIVDELVAALAALDYPRDKLDILIILEADDVATRVSFERVRLPTHMRILVVPSGQPRTKPRALNFALLHAQGDFVAVYDAEDKPEPDQLRRAYAVLRDRPETIGCVQARLNIYNAKASWLTRQFTIEYSALFDGMLPTLERFDLPIPLGGSSNHFPRHLIEALGGWDPYNVTEDADLGVRLARRGWRVAVIASTTWEEAPEHFGDWLKQRTRWLKGWMQTSLVHMRRPLRLMWELGERRFLSLQALLVGLVLSALVHPWFYVLIALEAWRGRIFDFPESFIAQSLWGLAALNLLVGYSVVMLLGVAAAFRRGHLSLAIHIVFLPVYWLAISLAAYRALYQLIRDPYLWEKTPHARSTRGARAAS